MGRQGRFRSLDLRLAFQPLACEVIVVPSVDSCKSGQRVVQVGQLI